MMESFFKLKRPAQVFEIMKDRFGPLGEESVPIEDALGRILSRDLAADDDMPGFYRSTMDGYAVRSRDTFGAAESLPAFFEIAGEVLMGRKPARPVPKGGAVKISTGGMLPEEADAVVMVEYCHILDEDTLEISRAVSPLENVIQPDDDVKKGETVLKRGDVIRPQDIGVMAGLGRSEVDLYVRPEVAVISTGDEVVSIDKKPLPGQVRDINRYTLSSFCASMGVRTVYTELCRDSFESLKDTIEKALSMADMVWISGGSSVGTRDLTLKVFDTLKDFELLTHGISISPGKPTIIGKAGSKPVIGLPGHVSSALIVAKVILAPLISILSGGSGIPGVSDRRVPAKMGRNIESAPGREDYIRVRLIRDGQGIIAEPVFGKSGLISTLVEADALVKIDINTEGLYKDQEVEAILLSDTRGGGL